MFLQVNKNQYICETVRFCVLITSAVDWLQRPNSEMTRWFYMLSGKLNDAHLLSVWQIANAEKAAVHNGSFSVQEIVGLEQNTYDINLH